MRKTSAYNSLIIGAMIGMLVWVSTNSAVLGILAWVGISLVGFVAIRALEKATYKGADAAADAIKKAYQQHKEKDGDEK
jgi:threonine/homoserine/homoserine lactone efflux protein